MARQAIPFEREVFTVSRELEYFTESELTTQTGYGRGDWWPFVIVKEAVDKCTRCLRAGRCRTGNHVARQPL
jgi:hypothetical protein